MGKSGTGQNRGARRSGLSSGRSEPPVINAEPETSPAAAASKPAAAAAGLYAAGLYIVATPIGNARDITLRGLDCLRAADVIVCEDTRVTSRLLAIHQIHRPLTTYHDHNAARAGPAIIRRLKQGQIVALVSDAGTPLVSDPGYRLVRACVEQGLLVTHLPGPSSVLAALVPAGLPTDRFMFAGFLNTGPARRRRELAELKTVPATLVFLESARRLAGCLGDMAAVLGPRQAAVGRELTKKFEEIRRDPLDRLAGYYAEAGRPRGEVTIIVAPPPDEDGRPDNEEIDRLLEAALGSMTIKDSVAAVTAATGAARRDVYARALRLGGGGK